MCCKFVQQIKKEVEEKDEFDALLESNVKPLDDRLGNSPEKLEKKIASKKGTVYSIKFSKYSSAFHVG